VIEGRLKTCPTTGFLPLVDGLEYVKVYRVTRTVGTRGLTAGGSLGRNRLKSIE
jgi:hypothetical protein